MTRLFVGLARGRCVAVIFGYSVRGWGDFSRSAGDPFGHRLLQDNNSTRGASNCCLPFAACRQECHAASDTADPDATGASPDLQTLSPRDPDFALD